MNNLYPLKFTPILKPIIWGGDEISKFKGLSPLQDGIGESWEISGVEDNISIVDNGDLKGQKLDELIKKYKDLLVGQSVFNRFGDKFPLLIKFIDARKDLSIQVHPNDELAMQRHHSFGKTEMWYMIKAQKDAFLYSGFTKEITPEKYVESIANNTFVNYLDKHQVKAGDVFFLPAGRVHAIGAGTFVAEIQQTSNITYRIYDYNRKDAEGKTRELHTELAKDAIDYNIYDNHKTNYQHKIDDAVKLESCEYFTTNLLELENELHRDYSKLDSFVILICMGGKCFVTDNKGNSVTVKQGETVLIPADTTNISIKPDQNVLLLETYI